MILLDENQRPGQHRTPRDTSLARKSQRSTESRVAYFRPADFTLGPLITMITTRRRSGSAPIPPLSNTTGWLLILVVVVYCSHSLTISNNIAREERETEIGIDNSIIIISIVEPVALEAYSHSSASSSISPK